MDLFKVFIEFVTILLLFYVWVFWLRGMWDPSSPTRDQTRTPCIGRLSLNYWTTREVHYIFLLNWFFLIEKVLYLFIYLLAVPRGMWDLGSATRD